MSKVPPTGPSDPTRQQLDELDALLQRMLDLPVNQLGDAPPSEKAGSANASPTASSPSATLPQVLRPPVDYVVVETSGPNAAQAQAQKTDGEGAKPKQQAVHENVDDWVPLRSAWRPSSQTWPPLADSWTRAQQQEPAQAGASQEQRIAPGAAQDAEPVTLKHPSVVALAESQVKEARPPQVPALLRPIVAFDRYFYSCVARIGPPGRWLAGSAGRTLLGAIGLGCLGAALALVWSAK